MKRMLKGISLDTEWSGLQNRWSGVVTRFRKVFFKDKTIRKNFLKILPQGSIGAEIGVLSGAYTRCILEVVNPKELHLIDGWWTIYGEYFPWSHRNTQFGALKTKDAYEATKKIVEEYDKNKACRIYVEDDLKRLSRFDNNYFDWVYLDASHNYGQVAQELEILKSKIKKDGYILGHDWQTNPAHKHHGVYRAVKEFCIKYEWEIFKLDYCFQWCIRRNKE